MIESSQNQTIKYINRLKANRRFRDSENCFVMEGGKWLREASLFPNLLTAVFYTDIWFNNKENEALLTKVVAKKAQVTQSVMNSLSDTTTPSGVLAIGSKPNLPLPKKPSFILILDTISDPGNMGTLIRTAAAAGVEAILLSPNCVDIFNPKVVRSSMGGILKIPILQKSWPEIQAFSQKLATYALDAQGSTPYTAVDWTVNTSLIVGNEGHGLSKKSISIAANLIAIPMHDSVESLNASMAAGIVLFEAVRQKRA